MWKSERAEQKAEKSQRTVRGGDRRRTKVTKDCGGVAGAEIEALN